MASIPVLTELTIWVQGWPIREREITTRGGQETLSALRWKNEVAYQVHRRVYPLDQAHPYQPAKHYRSVSVTYRFQGIVGEASEYVKLTRAAIAVALLIAERKVTTASVSSEPGEPGCWLEIEVS